MLKLAAFADEISPELDEQIRVCRENGISHFELRSVYGTNVLDLDRSIRNEIKTKLAASGMAVASIGSPIGKVKISDDWNQHYDRFKTAVELAEFFKAPFVRVFSYYPDDRGEIQRYREEVIHRFQEKVRYVSTTNVTIVHENEAKIFGERCAQCLDLMRSVNSPKLRMAFDFANFVQAGEKPIECWPALKPYTAHIHIKDAKLSDGSVVPAGQGDGNLLPILTDAYASGYRGFLSLEPHLQQHGQFGGFTGARLFKVAADALKTLCAEARIPLEEFHG